MSRILHETGYCKLLKEGVVQEGEDISAVQKIWIKALKREEIRFAWYKEKEGIKQFIPRPLDVTEDELLRVLEQGFKQEVFSPVFQEKLKSLLT